MTDPVFKISTVKFDETGFIACDNFTSLAYVHKLALSRLLFPGYAYES